MDNKAIYKLTYGLFVVTARENDRDNGCIVNTVAQVTSEPIKISVAINKVNYTQDMVKNTGKIAISVISEDADFELFKRFGFQSGREMDKFEGFNDFQTGKDDLKYVTKGTNAYIAADVVEMVDAGTHTIFICEVTDMKVLSDTPSATYAYYHEHIKPKPESKNQDNGKTIWRCQICGYEYEGDELPDDFVCPLCKHPASDFEKIL